MSMRRIQLLLVAIVVFSCLAFLWSNSSPEPAAVLPARSRRVFSSDYKEFQENEAEQPKKEPCPDLPLKVYMYDLPEEFHFGMIQQRQGESSSVWPEELPRYPGGLNSQHSPEYWLTADLLASSKQEVSHSSAVRVLDPDQADVFFVPFFSSLSYNKFSKDNSRLEARLVSFLRNQPYWNRKGGRDHVIPMHHPNSLSASRNQLRAAMFVVADFGRYHHKVANRVKDIVAPYKHLIPTFVNDNGGYGSRETLLFFQGVVVRKEGGIVRQQLHDVLRGKPGVEFVTSYARRDGVRSATDGMRKAKYCLHPAGDTPSSNRLFDAIVNHCVPVIVSDDIELPFEDVLDYSQFSVFVEAKEAVKPGALLRILERISEEEWTRMWLRLKEVAAHFEYQSPSQPADAVQMTWEAIARRRCNLVGKRRRPYLRDN